MDLKTLRAELQKLAALVEGWSDSYEIADIERDLALEKLRALYDAVRFGPIPAEKPSPADDTLRTDLPLVEIDLDAVLPPAGGQGTELSSDDTTGAEASAEESAPVASGFSAGTATAVTAAPEPVGEASEVSGATGSPVFVAPVASEVAPAASEVAPVASEVAPAASEVAPVASEVAPVASEVAPVASEVAPVASEVAPAASEVAPARAEEPEVVARGPVAEATSQHLFEVAPLDSKRAKHRVVLSLYGEAEPVGPVCPVAEERVAPQPSAGMSLPAPEGSALAPEGSAASAPVAAAPESDVPVADVSAMIAPAPVFAPAAEPIAAESTVLGETLNADVTTVSDLMAAAVSSTAVGQEPVTDLHRALCNNDRFLLARDLFGGDMEACERTIDRLNAFDDLDECMIYIAENFDWNPHSDGAKLLVDLIERKLA